MGTASLPPRWYASMCGTFTASSASRSLSWHLLLRCAALSPFRTGLSDTRLHASSRYFETEWNRVSRNFSMSAFSNQNVSQCCLQLKLGAAVGSLPTSSETGVVAQFASGLLLAPGVAQLHFHYHIMRSPQSAVFCNLYVICQAYRIYESRPCIWLKCHIPPVGVQHLMEACWFDPASNPRMETSCRETLFCNAMRGGGGCIHK
jgi:hypothetical protein